MFAFLKRDNDRSIAVHELDELIGSINLIDIRETYEFSAGHIKTAKNIPMGELLSQPQRYLDKNKKYYLICQSGMRSSRTVDTLHNLGYQVVNVKGGMGAYHGINRQ